MKNIQLFLCSGDTLKYFFLLHFALPCPFINIMRRNKGQNFNFSTYVLLRSCIHSQSRASRHKAVSAFWVKLRFWYQNAQKNVGYISATKPYLQEISIDCYTSKCKSHICKLVICV